jgi:GTP-binding protein HflX
MINDAIKRTKERLTKVKKQRSTQRRQRDRRNAFNVSLVGYTNAGKSTLFNALVKARAYAADQLFATLDTTTRQLYLGQAGRSASISDTVGFIRDLPHGLIDAFQATLKEATESDLLLHVVDASNVNFPEQMAEVQRVLHEIGAHDVPQWLIFNKIDLLSPERQPTLTLDRYDVEGNALQRIFVSAHSGDGIPMLRQLLAQEVLRTLDEEALEPDMRFDLDNIGENPDESL